MPIEKLQDIFEQLQNNASLMEAYGVQTIGVFGSFVRGEQNPDSDIDMLVTFAKSTGYFEFYALQVQLERIFDRKVDLVTHAGLHPVIKEKVLQEIAYGP